jgi:hypothetical protein
MPVVLLKRENPSVTNNENINMSSKRVALRIYTSIFWKYM